MNLRAKGAVLFLACALGSCGCSVQYNNSLVEVGNEIQKEQILASDYLKEQDLEKLKQKVAQARDRVNRLIEKGRAIKPLDTSEGKAYHAAFDKFLKAADKFFNEDLKEFVELRAQGYPQLANTLFREASKAAKEASDEMGNAQKEFVKSL